MPEVVEGTINLHFEDLNLYRNYLNSDTVLNYRIMDFVLSSSSRLQSFLLRKEQPDWVYFRNIENLCKSGF